MRDLKISFIQSDIVWEDPEENRKKFADKISKLKSGDHLIILPEMFNTAFPVDPRQFAEKIDGPTFEWMHESAKQANAVITGSLMIEDDGRYFNCLVWMEPSGNYRTYFKRHVFHLGEESGFISKGMGKIICDLHGWKISPMICYDLRFPVWVKNTYRDGKFEYDLLIFVANWPEIRNYPWKQLLIARAMENQSYVIGLNRVGVDDKGMSYSGDSMLIGPDGKVLSAAGAGKEESISTRLSAGDLKEFRKSFNVGADWDNFTIHH
ncbi:MAG: nitrilase family protein [Bacteroidales bacterium]|nr:nitrilase family protein [Bacteroidales bacterium]MCF8387063.1 nitrilase family protein [Bacteroidales bacterium]MCF8397757.1 nitrilase family protein [Bacteroidales bacterium]